MNYTQSIQFEWDEVKSCACAKNRGFDFTYAARIFSNPNRILLADTRYSYGEERYQTIGNIEERLYVVVYTPRHRVIRIISARKANQREIKQYENHTKED